MNPVKNSIDLHSSKISSILICAESVYGLDLRNAVLDSGNHWDITFQPDPLQIMPQLLGGDFDLLLLDIDMAGLNSVTIIDLVRDRYSAIELPILIVTGMQSLDKRNAVLAAGANDYLNKPFDPTEVSLRINNHLAIRNFHKSSQAIHNNLEREVKKRTAKLDLLINSGLMMAMERSRDKLLNHILLEGQRLLNCDGGTMYLTTKQNSLRFAERTREDILPFMEIPLYDPETGRANESYVSVYAALHKQSVIIDDIYLETRFDWSGTRDFDAQSGYRTVSMLTVPMAPRNGEVIGILQFFNALDPESGAIIPFPDDMTILVEALAAQAAVALDNLQLVQGQKNTTENIIQVIAAAVDLKSPHTGHHCARVPELALMLAEAACKAKGPLADFNFQSEDEWFEFRVGAWLHDCGKVTTPEYVIEKATKLDMINNRIHEIRMRFEVLLRDAEIVRLQKFLKGGDEISANAVYEKQKAELLNDFSFIAECNLGNENMDPAHIERIKAIAQKTWLRNFDDRLGLSWEEIMRRQDEPKHSLPVQEFLLCDKPYHIIPRRSDEAPDPGLGIKMTIPENRYNYGEIYNLTVQKGTLTPEDRYKINEHSIETIKMLEQLPFPDFLKRVPEYATTHHETLDGRGYPRRLKASDLSIPARIMAIADIFEALTSSDRPYKEPYKLSESLRILYGMKLDHHIDPDLFDLFLTSGVYLIYAGKFLTSAQIDEVDITQFLGPLSDQWYQ